MTREHFEEDQRKFRGAATAMAEDKDRVAEEVAPMPAGGMDFADAMRVVLDGDRVRRSGWNGKGMYLKLGNVVVDNNAEMVCVCMYTAQQTLVPWLASVTDMVANDWETVD